jgi:hypothetical protein
MIRDAGTSAHTQISILAAIQAEARSVVELQDIAVSSTEKSFRIPHISLAAVSSLVGFLWLFPKTLGDHPILGNLAHKKLVNALWAIALLISLLV